MCVKEALHERANGKSNRIKSEEDRRKNQTANRTTVCEPAWRSVCCTPRPPWSADAAIAASAPDLARCRHRRLICCSPRSTPPLPPQPPLWPDPPPPPPWSCPRLQRRSMPARPCMPAWRHDARRHKQDLRRGERSRPPIGSPPLALHLRAHARPGTRACPARAPLGLLLLTDVCV